GRRELSLGLAEPVDPPRQRRQHRKVQHHQPYHREAEHHVSTMHTRHSGIERSKPVLKFKLPQARISHTLRHSARLIDRLPKNELAARRRPPDSVWEVILRDFKNRRGRIFV